MQTINTKEIAKKDPFYWSCLNRELKPGQFYTNENYWFQKDIIGDMSKLVVVKKSAQLGLSELMIMNGLWFLENRDEGVLYCLPTDANAVQFSKLKITAIVDQMPHMHALAEETRKRERKEKREQNSVKIKQFGRNSMVITGMQGNRTNLESFSIGFALLDEFDKIKDMEAVELIDKRLKASKYKWKRYFSTPVFPGGPIDILYNKGKQLRWNISCDHCGLEQNPNFFTHHNKFSKIAEVQERSPQYVCEECNSRLQVLKRGRFVAKNPDAKYNSYHINTVFIPDFSADEDGNAIVNDSSEIIWEKYEDALTDPTVKMPEFYRQELGEGYLSDNDGLSIQHIKDCQDKGIVSSEFRRKDGVDYIVGGDIGKSIHLVVKEVDKETRVVKLVHFLRVEHTNQGTIFENLDKFIKYLEPVMGCFDMYPEPVSMTNICRENKQYNIKVVQFNSGLASPTLFKNSNNTSPEQNDEFIMLANRTMGIDISMSLVKSGEQKMPIDLDKEFITHFTNIIRTQDGKGRYVYTGKNGGKMPDHYLFANVYCDMCIPYVSAKVNIDSSEIIVGKAM